MFKKKYRKLTENFAGKKYEKYWQSPQLTCGVVTIIEVGLKGNNFSTTDRCSSEVPGGVSITR